MACINAGHLLTNRIKGLTGPMCKQSLKKVLCGSSMPSESTDMSAVFYHTIATVYETMLCLGTHTLLRCVIIQVYQLG